MAQKKTVTNAGENGKEIDGNVKAFFVDLTSRLDKKVTSYHDGISYIIGEIAESMNNENNIAQSPINFTGIRINLGNLFKDEMEGEDVKCLRDKKYLSPKLLFLKEFSESDKNIEALKNELEYRLNQQLAQYLPNKKIKVLAMSAFSENFPAWIDIAYEDTVEYAKMNKGVYERMIDEILNDK